MGRRVAPRGHRVASTSRPVRTESRRSPERCNRSNEREPASFPARDRRVAVGPARPNASRRGGLGRVLDLDEPLRAGEPDAIEAHAPASGRLPRRRLPRPGIDGSAPLDALEPGRCRREGREGNGRGSRSSRPRVARRCSRGSVDPGGEAAADVPPRPVPVERAPQTRAAVSGRAERARTSALEGRPEYGEPRVSRGRRSLRPQPSVDPRVPARLPSKARLHDESNPSRTFEPSSDANPDFRMTRFPSASQVSSAESRPSTSLGGALDRESGHRVAIRAQERLDSRQASPSTRIVPRARGTDGVQRPCASMRPNSPAVTVSRDASTHEGDGDSDRPPRARRPPDRLPGPDVPRSASEGDSTSRRSTRSRCVPPTRRR